MEIEIKKNPDYKGEECPLHIVRNREAFLEEIGFLYDDLELFVGSVGSYTIRFLKNIEEGEQNG